MVLLPAADTLDALIDTLEISHEIMKGLLVCLTLKDKSSSLYYGKFSILMFPNLLGFVMLFNMLLSSHASDTA